MGYRGLPGTGNTFTSNDGTTSSDRAWSSYQQWRSKALEHLEGLRSQRDQADDRLSMVLRQFEKVRSSYLSRKVCFGSYIAEYRMGTSTCCVKYKKSCDKCELYSEEAHDRLKEIIDDIQHWEIESRYFWRLANNACR